jgi:NAD(P)H-dependent FMN reductase
MPLHIPVILGTVREGRQSEHVARYVHGRLAARPGVESPFIDPREWPFQNLVQREFEMAQRPPRVVEFVDLMHAADAFVIVTPEYNYGFPGALKNLLDVTFKPWNRKPFGLVGCGGVSGGLRALDMLRQTVAGLGAVAVPQHIPVPNVGKAFGPDGPLAEPEEWAKRIDTFLGHVEWYAKALQAARQAPH